MVEKDEHPPDLKAFVSRAKNRQETFHGRLKNFNILGHRFRHKGGIEKKLRQHQMAVHAVACIIQYDYDNGHPPFDMCWNHVQYRKPYNNTAEAEIMFYGPWCDGYL